MDANIKKWARYMEKEALIFMSDEERLLQNLEDLKEKYDKKKTKGFTALHWDVCGTFYEQCSDILNSAIDQIKPLALKSTEAMHKSDSEGAAKYSDERKKKLEERRKGKNWGPVRTKIEDFLDDYRYR